MGEIIEITGIIGTLLGTILGWVLSTITNNSGRLKLVINTPIIEFLKRGEDLFSQDKVEYNEEPTYINISICISAYNSYKKFCGICKMFYILRTDMGEYYLEPSLRGIEELRNIETGKMVNASIYFVENCTLANETVQEIKRGFTLYLAYNVNNRRFTRRIKLKSEPGI